MRRWLFGLTLVVLLAGSGVAWLLRTDDTSGAVDLRAITVPDAGSQPGEPGVYRYETTGYEAVDAFSGARHDYPAVTHLTIVAGPCGPVARWVVLEERWVEWEHCGPGEAITTTRSHHQWFGVGDLEVETCSAPLPLVPGGETTVVCTAGDTTETFRVVPSGMETITVAGIEVVTERVTTTSELSGGSTGSSRVDSWVLPGTVLVVRTEVERHTVTPSPVGDIAYDEEYTLVLVALRPEASARG